MSEQYQPGAKVQLVSGGKAMTVARLDASGEVANCVWMRDDGVIETHLIPTVCLTVYLHPH